MASDKQTGRNDAASAFNCVLILVHGTWSKSAWAEPKSKFYKSLSREVPEGTLIDKFKWSGRNLVFSRAKAAERLSEKISETGSLYPGVPIFLASHSHGGTVSLLSQHSCEIMKLTAGTFRRHSRTFRERRSFREGNSAGFLFAIWAFSAALVFILLGWTLYQLPRTPLVEWIRDHFWLLYLLPGVMGGVIYGVAWPFGKLADRIRILMTLPDSAASNLLLIRMSGDEASIAIIGAQFAGWILFQVFGRTSALLADVQDWTNSNNTWVRRLRSFCVSLVFFVFLSILVLTSLAFGILEKRAAGDTVSAFISLVLGTLWVLSI